MIPEELEDHPPSDKFVYHLLDDEGAMTLRDLESETRLPISTASAAVRRLRKADLIAGRPDPRKPGHQLWYVDDDDSSIRSQARL